MEKFAEQDRLEQMNAQKRRLKVAQHAREVERLIQQKREMFEAAMVRHILCSTSAKVNAAQQQNHLICCVPVLHLSVHDLGFDQHCWHILAALTKFK